MKKVLLMATLMVATILFGVVEVTNVALTDSVFYAGEESMLVQKILCTSDSAALTDGINLQLQSTAQYHDFQVKLFIDDNLIDTENVYETGIFSFNTTFEIPEGDHELSIRLTNADPTITETIRFIVTSFVGTESIETGQLVAVLHNGLELSADNPVMGQVCTLLSGGVVVTTMAVADTVIVAGIDDVIAQRFIVINNEVDAINISSTNNQLFGTGNCEEYGYFVTAVFEDSLQQGSTKNPDSLGFIGFNDLAIIIPPGEQKELFIVQNTNKLSDPGTIQYSVTSIVAQRLGKDGQKKEVIPVMNGGQELSETNPVMGRTFTLVESGILTVRVAPEIASSINEKIVIPICLRAKDDEIQVKDLYFKNLLYQAGVNEFATHATFKLYGPDEQLIQEKQMQIGDLLHFEFPNQSRIKVPKNDSIYVAICMELNDINHNGERLQLALDTDHVSGGIEALTSVTGEDIPTPAEGWGELISDEFVFYSVSGSQSGVWPKGIYLVGDDLHIAEGNTLFMEEGVEVVFTEAEQSFTIEGTLRAMGDTGNVIKISSLNEEPWYLRVNLDGDVFLHYNLMEGGTIFVTEGLLQIVDSHLDETGINVTNGQLDLVRNYLLNSPITSFNSTLTVGDCEIIDTVHASETIWVGTDIDSTGNVAFMGTVFNRGTVYIDNISDFLDIRFNDFIDTDVVLICRTDTKEKGNRWIMNNTFVGRDGSFDITALTIRGNLDGEIVSNNIFFNLFTALNLDTDSPPTLENNCFWGNDIRLVGGENVSDFGSITNTNANGDYCDPYNNIFMDPHFFDYWGNDFRIMSGSPCIDAGTSGSDIGAHEFDSSGIEMDEDIVPNKINLEQNYPNPFNPTTTIKFNLVTDTKVALVVYNVAGKEVVRLVDGNLNVGSHQVSFDASRLVSGIYYYMLHTPEKSVTKKMLLTK